VLDDVLLVVAALPGGDGVDAQLVQVDRVILADAEPARGAFPVGDDEVDGIFLAQLWEELFHDPDT
jgi:hypothetical protein